MGISCVFYRRGNEGMNRRNFLKDNWFLFVKFPLRKGSLIEGVKI